MKTYRRTKAELHVFFCIETKRYIFSEMELGDIWKQKLRNNNKYLTKSKY